MDLAFPSLLQPLSEKFFSIPPSKPEKHLAIIIFSCGKKRLSRSLFDLSSGIERKRKFILQTIHQFRTIRSRTTKERKTMNDKNERYCFKLDKVSKQQKTVLKKKRTSLIKKEKEGETRKKYWKWNGIYGNQGKTGD